MRLGDRGPRLCYIWQIDLDSHSPPSSGLEVLDELRDIGLLADAENNVVARRSASLSDGFTDAPRGSCHQHGLSDEIEIWFVLFGHHYPFCRFEAGHLNSASAIEQNWTNA